MADFSRIEITPNDDGTFLVEISPKEKKGKDGAVPMNYGDRKRIVANSIDEVVSKIKGGAGQSKKAKKDDEDLEDFMTKRHMREGKTK